MAYKESGTSSSVYKCRLDVDVLDNSNTTSNGKVKVRLTPRLKHTQGAVRKQHRWHVYFKVDGVDVKTYSYTGSTLHNLLPNDTAQAEVVRWGELYMNAGQWYQWGSSFDYEVPNDGQAHSFKLYMACTETIPRHCPAQGEWVEVTLQTTGYKVIPPAPSGLKLTYNEDTRVLSYTWDDASCSYIKLWRNLFDSDGNIIPGKSGYVAPAGQGVKLYNVNKPFQEIVPEGTALVTYEMVNVSSSGHETSSGHQQLSITTDNKVLIKVGNTWKKAVPWVKVGNTWKKATKTYIKVGNTWKRTIT